MNSQDVSRKYDRFGHFKPVGEYDEQRGWLFEYSKGLRIESKILETIIGLDILLRQFTQRIDWLERKMQTMKKIECTQDDLKILQKYENEVKDYKHTILEFEGKLYSLETLLPERPLRRTYRKIRQNPAWYLRKELIDDCKERGGCCGRGCGCCEHRHRSQTRRNGIGHCTIDCWCCGISRGLEITTEESGKISQEVYDLLTRRDPAYLLVLAEAYFCMPGMFGLGRISFLRTIRWYWKKDYLWQWKRASDWLWNDELTG